jgi:hypothetical protein
VALSDLLKAKAEKDKKRRSAREKKAKSSWSFWMHGDEKWQRLRLHFSASLAFSNDKYSWRLWLWRRLNISRIVFCTLAGERDVMLYSHACDRSTNTISPL